MTDGPHPKPPADDARRHAVDHHAEVHGRATKPGPDATDTTPPDDSLESRLAKLACRQNKPPLPPLP